MRHPLAQVIHRGFFMVLISDLHQENPINSTDFMGHGFPYYSWYFHEIFMVFPIKFSRGNENTTAMPKNHGIFMALQF